RSRCAATSSHAEPTRAIAPNARVPISMRIPGSPGSRPGAVAPAPPGEADALSCVTLPPARLARGGRAGASAPRPGPAAAATPRAGPVGGCEGAASVLLMAGAGVTLPVGAAVAAGCGAGVDDAPLPSPAGPVALLPVVVVGDVAPVTLTVPAS